jgi:hypothetical protein
MPLFMDSHTIAGGVRAEDVAAAHKADLQAQAQHDVSYLRYWVDEQQGRIFCLVEAPSAEAAVTVHRQAHGLLADDISRCRKAAEPPPLTERSLTMTGVPTHTVPAARRAGQAVILVLTVAGLSLSGVTAAAAAPPAPTVAHTSLADPCPCDNPVCRPLCRQTVLRSMGSGSATPGTP